AKGWHSGPDEQASPPPRFPGEDDLYVYADDVPTTFIDPLGLDPHPFGDPELIASSVALITLPTHTPSSRRHGPPLRPSSGWYRDRGCASSPTPRSMDRSRYLSSGTPDRRPAAATPITHQFTSLAWTNR